MTLTGLLSQALLLTGGSYLLFIPGYADERLAALLLAISLLSLVHVYEGRRWRLIPLGLLCLLCLFTPHFLPFLPCALYAAWDREEALPVGLMLLAPLAAHVPQLSLPLGLLMAAAALLRWKDSALKQLSLRYFAQRDELSLRDERRKQELESLQREQENGIKLAIAQERNRIARDIHDNVGHLLSRSILQVGAMSLSASGEDQQQAFQELQQSLSAGMDAVRRSVHNTRQDALQLDQEVQALIEAFRFCPVSYQNHSDAELSLNHKYVLLAAIKEALSNVMRHSTATRVDIRLSRAGPSHVLLIRDNGRPTGAKPGGMGLMAMEERVRALKGSMHISTDKGFRILITVPMEEL